MPYAAVTKMKKAQACPEVAHSQAIEDTGGKQLQKHVVRPLTALGPG